MYLYENLGAERFQEFCQALLLPTYPDLQCFPVGQPDGGRDGTSRARGTGSNAVTGTVVQVKYKRTDEAENADWMIEALSGELPKVQRLANRGAKRYVMMTNARGTAHLDSGRIDRVQDWLDENFPIDSQVLWRDDLDRRVEMSDPDLKLQFPAILTGNDVLLLLVEAQMGPEKARIARTFKAFVSKQFDEDQKIKFRQVDLANTLLGLFVDVPAETTPILWQDSTERLSLELRSAVLSLSVTPSRRLGIRAGAGEYFGPKMIAGTADLLLASAVQRALPWILLNGAPGQGKSTVAQYVCQVHRARYLDKTKFLAEIKDSHAASPFRLPIKVDLRDFALYIEGRSYLNQSEISTPGSASLERFLASLIATTAGGLQFSADDVVSVLTSSPSLIFFDGLDEVGDLDLRRMVVDKTIEGLSRLNALDADLQVVMTSRPSLFGAAPELPKSFHRLELTSITHETIRRYADKWTGAKGLEPDHAREVTSILEQKLELPHIAELTKNPMQLTILLNLISAKGHSLPDARTDLYREYVNLFMTREAEKSPMVRVHQPLLLAVLEFLAWRLQAEAEAEGSAGSIEHDDLRALVSDYLVKAEQDIDILDDLFSGGFERVYVLVQRVEGLYEFEVQPLREYFAAKYLYSSAPVRTFRVDHVPGDRAQRFEAIALNPYWTNVTRFYSGFYEDGELGALSTSLNELIGSNDLACGIIARAVGASLLTDWVFSNKKAIQSEVVRMVFDPVGLELAAHDRLPGFEGILDRQCGRDALAKILFDHVTDPTRKGVEQPICKLLARNGGQTFRREFESWCTEATGEERTGRLRIALASAGLVGIDAEKLDELVFDDGPSPRELRYRIDGLVRHSEHLLEASEKCARATLDSLLRWGGVAVRSPSTAFGAAARLLDTDTYYGSALFDLPIPSEGGAIPPDVVSVLAEIIAAARTPGESPHPDWEDPERLDARLENLRAILGDVWALYRIALVDIAVVRPTRGPSIREDPESLLSQAQSARNFRGRSKWWAEQVEANTGEARLFRLSLLLAWAPSKDVRENLRLIDDELASLDESDFVRLTEVLQEAHLKRRVRGGRSRNAVTVAGSINERLGLALYCAFGVLPAPRRELEGTDSARLEKVLRAVELRDELEAFPGWSKVTSKNSSKWLDVFTRARLSPVWREFVEHMDFHATHMRLQVVRKILDGATSYPAILIANAAQSVQAMYTPPSVRTVAENERWIFD